MYRLKVVQLLIIQTVEGSVFSLQRTIHLFLKVQQQGVKMEHIVSVGVEEVPVHITEVSHIG